MKYRLLLVTILLYNSFLISSENVFTATFLERGQINTETNDSNYRRRCCVTEDGTPSCCTTRSRRLCLLSTVTIICGAIIGTIMRAQGNPK